MNWQYSHKSHCSVTVNLDGFFSQKKINKNVSQQHTCVGICNCTLNITQNDCSENKGFENCRNISCKRGQHRRKEEREKKKKKKKKKKRPLYEQLLVSKVLKTFYSFMQDHLRLINEKEKIVTKYFSNVNLLSPCIIPVHKTTPA